MSVLVIDAGTTGVTALVVGSNTQVQSRGYREFPQHFPQPGWVEHSPDEIWTATLDAARDALAACPSTPTCVGITNQRETVVLWDRDTLDSPRPAIVWQDRRTSGMCEQLRQDGHESVVSRTTGLRLDPYFSATKLAWIASNEPHVWSGVVSGRTAIGTVDSYLVARMSRGLHHITDASNASRTLLFDIHRGVWSEELCALFGVSKDALPTVVASYGDLAHTDPSCFLGLDLPITGIAGDQQAALFGQCAFNLGDAKCTYGTGSFVLVNTGADAVSSHAGLLTTVAHAAPDGSLTYALEGSVFVTGAAIQWLRDGLGVIDAAHEVNDLAASVPDAGGVVFVPALAGLGAPDWDPSARGVVVGITRGTTAAHLARATLDAIAFQVRDVIDLMVREASLSLPALAVDGGASASDLLCQLQADQLGVPVLRPEMIETTGLGAAFLAGLGAGVWQSRDELIGSRRIERTFHPGRRDENAHRLWRAAVERAKGWALET
ncbi:MAG: glycerol kinase [Actinomycetia bacterium]|nr:glycerol kinase [Actinomycetes bacterium]